MSNTGARPSTVSLAAISAGLLLSTAAWAGPQRPSQNQLSSPTEDAERINRLTSTGVLVESGRVTAWFAAYAMSPE